MQKKLSRAKRKKIALNRRKDALNLFARAKNGDEVAIQEINRRCIDDIEFKKAINSLQLKPAKLKKVDYKSLGPGFPYKN